MKRRRYKRWRETFFGRLTEAIVVAAAVALITDVVHDYTDSHGALASSMAVLALVARRLGRSA